MKKILLLNLILSTSSLLSAQQRDSSKAALPDYVRGKEITLPVFPNQHGPGGPVFVQPSTSPSIRDSRVPVEDSYDTYHRWFEQPNRCIKNRNVVSRIPEFTAPVIPARNLRKQLQSALYPNNTGNTNQCYNPLNFVKSASTLTSLLIFRRHMSL